MHIHLEAIFRPSHCLSVFHALSEVKMMNGFVIPLCGPMLLI